jgi:hypothetical protein
MIGMRSNLSAFESIMLPKPQRGDRDNLGQASFMTFCDLGKLTGGNAERGRIGSETAQHFDGRADA